MTELKGRHGITLGSSITAPSTTTMHALKYNFQPSTMDSSRPSTLSGDPGGDYTLLVPSKEGQTHVFKGPETAGKEIDCLLIYDSSTGNYVLERVGSVLRLDHQRHAQVAVTAAAAVEEASERETTVPVSVPVKSAPKIVLPAKESVVEKDDEEEEEDDDDDELDDFANLLESTLDASAQKPSNPSSVAEGGKIHTPVARRPSEHVRIESREDESSEDED